MLKGLPGWRALGGLVVVCSILLASPRRAEAQPGLAPSDQGQPKLQLATPGLGSPKSVDVARAFGTLMETVALETPPGRKDVHPNLALTYGSLGSLGPTGLGWNLAIGSIQRSQLYGAAPGPDVDRFVLSVGGSQVEIVPVGGGFYRPRFETTFRTIHFDGTSWEVTRGDGTVLRFGQTAQTRIAGQVWALNQIEDHNGNTMTFRYLRDGGQLYPREIDYAGNAKTGDAGASRLTFDYESRPDARIDYRLGIRQDLGLRLARVSMFVQGQLVRRYEPSYVQGATTGRSLLSAIDLVGSDDQSRLHARSYTYLQPGQGWSGFDTQGALPAAFNDADGKDLGVRIADVNGDGFADLLSNTDVWLGDGQGDFTRNTSWSDSLAATGVRFVDGDGIDKGGRILDVNGDGRPDVLIATSATKRVFLNDGAGWALDDSFTQSIAGIVEPFQVQLKYVDPNLCDVPDGGVEPDQCNMLVDQTALFRIVNDDGDSTGVEFADVNGDGLVDILWSFETTPRLFHFTLPDGKTVASRVPERIRAVYLNTGTGWVRNDARSDALRSIDPSFVVDTEIQGYEALDVNGDGLADLVQTLGSQPRRVLLNNGTGWTLDDGYTSSLQATDIITLDDNAKNLGVLPVDFNGDGLIDFIRADDDGVRAYRNTGTGFVADASVANALAADGLVITNGDGQPQGVLLGDVDGDGAADILQSRTGGPNRIAFDTFAFQDLMSSATSGYGEVDTITYAPSTAFDNRDASGIEGLPTVLPVVASLARSDGRSSPVLAQYTYSGGLYQDRQFRGFAQTLKDTSSGHSELTTFEQSEALVGHTRLSEVLDASGAIRQRNTLGWEVTDAAPGVQQVKLATQRTEIIDPGGTRAKEVDFAYDDHLNMVEAERTGDESIDGDESRTVLTYASSNNSRLTSLVARVSVYGADGRLMSQSTNFYDGLPEGEASTGNITRVVDAVDDQGTTVQKTIEYDDYGNIVRASDHEGHFTTFSYDDVHHAFRVAAVDPMGGTVETQFDPRFGRPTLEHDANGNATLRKYDAFGRLVLVQQPGDECSPNGTMRIAYSSLGNASNQFVKLMRTTDPGSADTLDQRTFFDGFLQSYRTEAEGPDGTPIVVERVFDDLGHVVRESKPFFAGKPASFTVTDRDALGRVTRVTGPDGTEQRFAYLGRQVQRTDRRGNVTTFDVDVDDNVLAIRKPSGAGEEVTHRRFDELGRLVQVVDADGQLTTIDYDLRGYRTRLVDPTVGTFQYRYDANGNLLQQIDPAGRSTTFAYNARDQLVQKKLSTGETIKLEYGTAADNAVARPVHIEDAAGTVDIAYDPRGNIVEERRHTEGETYVLGFDYNSLGQVTRILYPDGSFVRYFYDAAGFPDRIEDDRGRLIAQLSDYDADGQAQHVTFGNGVSSAYGYDARGRIASIETANARGDKLQGLTYARDPEGNILSIRDAVGEATQSFHYDAQNRLTRAVGQSYGERLYRYDALGDLVRKGDLLFAHDPGHRQRVTCGIDLSLARLHRNGLASDHRLTECISTLLASNDITDDERATLREIEAQARPGVQIGSSFAIRYDALGDMAEKNRIRRTFDGESRLVRVQAAPGRRGLQQNVYGHDGRRVVRKEPGHTTIFVGGIFEDHRTDHRGGVILKHVPLGGTIVATIEDPRLAVRLIHRRQSEDPLTQCGGSVAIAKTGMKEAAGAVMGALGGIGASTPSAAAPPQLRLGIALLSSLAGIAVLLVLALMELWRSESSMRARTLLVCKAQRTARATASGGRASWAQARRRPMASAVSALLVGVLLLQAGCTMGSHRQVGSDAQALGRPFETRAYYHLDQVGNTNVITGDHGEVIQRRDYLPFGELVTDKTRIEASDLERSLNGHTLDETTGLYDFGARHYDPVLGRFIAPDTQVPNGLEPIDLNRYAFNADNPLRFADANGRGFFDFIKKHIVDILVGIVLVAALVVAAVFTGGAVAIGIAIGLGVGALAGLVTGIVLASKGIISGPEILLTVLAGAFIGGLAGAGIGVLAAGANSAQVVLAFTLLGAAGGSGGGALSVGSPDLLMEGVVFGGIVGAAAGAVTGLLAANGVTLVVSAFGISSTTITKGGSKVLNFFGVKGGSEVFSLIFGSLFAIFAGGFAGARVVDAIFGGKGSPLSRAGVLSRLTESPTVADKTMTVGGSAAALTTLAAP